MNPKSLIIALEVGHMGKPHKLLDRGAPGPSIYSESDYALSYATVAFEALTRLGHRPYLITSGSYGKRAAESNQINADLHFSCHLNSSEIPPTTHHSLVEISEYSGDLTRKFAQHLADTFRYKLPVEDSGVRIIKKKERGWWCINRIKAPAFLLEPVFINHLLGQQLLENDIWLISNCIVSAIKLFNWGS